MHAETRKQLDSIARGWAVCGVLASEAEVRDFGCPGCSRPVVVVTFAERQWKPESRPGACDGYVFLGDAYIDECCTWKEAGRLAKSCNDRLWETYSKRVEELKGGRTLCHALVPMKE